MDSSEIERQADALDAYLQGVPKDNLPDLPLEEANLAQSIRQSVSSWIPDRQFSNRLEEQLKEKYKTANRFNWRSFLSTLLRDLAYVALLLLFIGGLNWSIRHLLPKPTAQPASNVQATATEIPTSTPTPLVEPLQPTLAPNAVRSPLFPNQQLILQAEFPQAPTSVSLYRQMVEQPITVETARQIAAQLGVNGHVYRPLQSESGQETLFVSDGMRRVFFSSNRRFFYIANYAQQLSRQGQPPDAGTARQVALEFLQNHNLLNLPYRFEAAVNRYPGTVKLVWMLDNRPVRYPDLEAPAVYVEVDSDNQVKTVEYNRLEIEKVGDYPIISAEEAWQKILSEYPDQGIEEYSGNSPIFSGNPQSWQRTYPNDTPIEIYGNLEMLQPAEEGVSPLFTLNNLTVQGNQQNLEKLAKSGKVVKVLGMIHQNEDGLQVLEVQSAVESDKEWYSISGEIKREGEQVYIVNDNQKALLLNPPTNLPVGNQADASGILQDEQKLILDWYWINSGYNSAGGGGGGGSSTPFRELNLSGDRSGLPTSTPLPDLAPTPQLGTRLEGESGILSMDIRQYADGKQVREAFWWMEPNPKFPDGLSLQLSGNLQGLEAYNQFPIRIWGTIEDNTQQPYRFNVERYVLTYPGLQPQTWVGTEQTATVAGKQVILFTDQAGNQFVLKSSIDFDPDNLMGAPGDEITISGFVYPDSDFGGYAVIREVSARVNSAKSGASSSQVPQGDNPFEIPVIPEAGVLEGSNVATVENIELVYYTEDLYFIQSQTENPPFYIQPVWRFSGHYENGETFEIMVQALTEQYLK